MAKNDGEEPQLIPPDDAVATWAHAERLKARSKIGNNAVFFPIAIAGRLGAFLPAAF